jgi:hypothetical protein
MGDIVDRKRLEVGQRLTEDSQTKKSSVFEEKHMRLA